MQHVVPFLGYEASAGSGKTFNLVVRYLSLLFSNHSAQNILALTFTNKAAGEMRERIMNTIMHLEHKDELDVIASQLNISRQAILEQKNSVLEDLFASEIKIMTIDKFFAKILRKFSLYEGIQPTFSIEEKRDNIEVLKHFLHAVDIANKQKELIQLALLTQKRFSGIFEWLDMLYLKQKELPQIALDMHNMTELKEQVLTHAENLKHYVDNHPDASATARKAFVFDSIEALMEKSFLKYESLNYRTFSRCYSPELDRMFEALKTALKAFYEAKEAHVLSGLFSLLKLYTKSRHHIIKTSNTLTFDDVTFLLHELLTNTVHQDFIYFRMDAKVHHMLLDEFQDTSVLQFEILRPLIEEYFSGSGTKEHKSFFYVGDVKQSIYRFRGGNKALFYDVRDRFSVTMKPLKVNYRSQKEVIDFVNRTFEGKIANYIAQEVRPEAVGGYVTTIEDETLLDALSNHVKRLIDLHIPAHHIAVLTWKNSQGLEVANTLHALGLNVVTETNAKLIEHRLVKAIIMMIKYYYFNEAIYLEGFYALKGERSQVVPINIDSMSVQALVHTIVKTYGIYHGDANVIRFIEVVAQYQDVDALIFEIQNQAANLVAIEQLGIRVLTVHKSKGLEFEHVVVLDRSGKAQSDNDFLVFEYEGVKLTHMFMRQKGREHVDSAYAKALEYTKQMRYEDELNAMYVAFTRAKHSLCIIQKPKGSIFEALKLENRSYGTLHKYTQNSSASNKTASLVYEAQSYGTQERPKKSSFEHAHNLEAIEFGLALHYALEMIARFEKEAIGDALVAMNNRFILDSDTQRRIKTRLNMLVDSAAFQGLLGSTYEKEQPFSYEGKLFYIDLLIMHETHYVVVDYKTSKEHTQKHHTQVAAYVDAIRAITQKSTQGYICYILDDSIDIVPVRLTI